MSDPIVIYRSDGHYTITGSPTTASSAMSQLPATTPHLNGAVGDGERPTTMRREVPAPLPPLPLHSSRPPSNNNSTSSSSQSKQQHPLMSPPRLRGGFHHGHNHQHFEQHGNHVQNIGIAMENLHHHHQTPTHAMTGGSSRASAAAAAANSATSVVADRSSSSRGCGGLGVVVVDWEMNLERQLQEATARAAQMEKTMRWWSDCTANWREKWSKVRTERNRSREEVKLLRAKLEMAIKDAQVARREKQPAETDNDLLRNELERCYSTMTGSSKTNDASATSTDQQQPNCGGSSSLLLLQSSSSLSNRLSPRALLPAASSAVPLLSPHDFDEVSTGNTTTTTNVADLADHSTSADTMETKKEGDQPFLLVSSSTSHLITDDVEYLQQKLMHCNLRLAEATKTIQVEREEKTGLHRAIERLQAEMHEATKRLDELRHVKQEAEARLLSSEEKHRIELVFNEKELKDEAAARQTLDRRLAELRAELERLQAENAAEWGRRERLETERLALERENRNLRAQVSDLTERIQRVGGGGGIVDSQSSSSNDHHNGERAAGAAELLLEERTRELIELRHAHNKLKKALQERSVELSHGLRRAEHSEAEVRRLRARIDELKREVASAQDELDTATNLIRKLQRTNDELQEEVDTLKKQVTFFQNRLRPAGGVVGRFHHHRSSTTDALLQKLLHHTPVSPSRHHMSLIDGEDDEDDEEDDFSVDLGFDCVEQHNDNASSAIVNKTSAPTSPSPSSDPHPPSKDLSSVVPSGSASNR